MPFRRTVSIDLLNETTDNVTVDATGVEYQLRPIDSDEAYLHAAFSQETTVPGQAFHQLLDIQGQGHYVGNLLWLANAQGAPSYILESDDVIIADNQTLSGTGLEDAYNGGYFYNWVGVQNNEPEGPKPTSVIRPFHGLLQMNPLLNGSGGFVGFYRVDQYRWHVPDYVPFKHALNVKVENYGQLGNVLLGSTAFFYLRAPVHADIDGDRDVTSTDLCIVMTALESARGDPDFISGADFDGDDQITENDLSIVLSEMDLRTE